MGWIIEVAKMLAVCVATALVLAAAVALFPLHNSKATGVDLIFRLTGHRLALVGALNVVVGLLLTRLTMFGDAAGKLHIALR